MPVHLYGQMCDMVALDALASKYGLKIIEDAAHCVEGERDRLRPGSGGSLACFSFYATKNLTCGEGGAITTNDDALYQRLRLLRLHGMSKTAIDRFRDGYSHWDMVAMGWKYNMSNIEAAILLPQFDRMDSKLAQREKLASLYEAHLAKDSRIRLFDRLPGIHARHVFTIRVKKRDEVIASLQSQSIGAVVNYRAVHLMSYFQELLNHPRGSFPNAEAIGDQVLSIPFYPQMPEEWVGRVSQAVRIALDVTQSAPFESL
jgi:dTDP-4-amino-4,6-dideoxygalactose transaminase